MGDTSSAHPSNVLTDGLQRRRSPTVSRILHVPCVITARFHCNPSNLQVPDSTIVWYVLRPGMHIPWPSRMTGQCGSGAAAPSSSRPCSQWATHGLWLAMWRIARMQRQIAKVVAAPTVRLPLQLARRTL